MRSLRVQILYELFPFSFAEKSDMIRSSILDKFIAHDGTILFFTFISLRRRFLNMVHFEISFLIKTDYTLFHRLHCTHKLWVTVKKELFLYLGICFEKNMLVKMNQFRHVIKKSCIQYFKESMTSTRKSNDIFTIDGLEQIPINSFRFVDFIVL